MNAQDTVEEASRIVLSYAPPDDDDVADGLEEYSFRSYLRKAHDGRVRLADEWEEFVSCGCGSTKDVTLCVVSITGGDAIGEETEIAYEPAEK